MSATPRPWAVYDEGDGDFSKWVISSETGVVTDNIRRADAELIVRALNAHDALVEALDGLVTRLLSIHEDEQYKGVWVSYAIHGNRYAGPTYTAELAAAQKALRLVRGES